MVACMRPFVFGRRGITSAALNVALHGPTQLFRPAMLLIWRLRQWRADVEPLLNRSRSPRDSAVSATRDGSKMNARSFDDPSPLMSPATNGVYRSPDCTRPAAVMPIFPPKKTCAAWSVTWCRGVNACDDHSI